MYVCMYNSTRYIQLENNIYNSNFIILALTKPVGHLGYNSNFIILALTKPVGHLSCC